MIGRALAFLLLAMPPIQGQAIDIGGTVKTDSDTPIAGARILLKNADLSDTTGLDGVFLIQSPGTRIQPGAASLTGSRLSAGLQGGVLTVSAVEGSRITLKVFSQLGEELFTGACLAAAGGKTIRIPGLGTGRVVVRIRSGEQSLAVQGPANQGSIHARISGASAAALEKGSAAIPDSLVVTKEGFLRRAVHLSAPNISGLEVRMTGMTGMTPTWGTFRVTLFPPGLGAGYAALVGAVYAGPKGVPLVWQEVGKAGNCRLLIPRPVFCDPSCGSTALCVAENTCQDLPSNVSVGTVTAKGIRTSQGTSEFTLAQFFKRYQPPSTLTYPPFAEGDDVSIRVTGDSGISPFSISTKGIGPLKMVADSIYLADGQPMLLEWAAPSVSEASTVSVLVDLSFHGGTRGKIECEGPDNGRLEIAATLVGQLKALGVSGYPKAEISRKSIGTHAESGVDLVLESPIKLTLSVPGLISCSDDGDCPTGQTCQADMQCK